MGWAGRLLGGVASLAVLGAVFVGGVAGGLAYTAHHGAAPVPQFGPPCRLADAADLGAELGHALTLSGGSTVAGLLPVAVDARELPDAPSCVGGSLASGQDPGSVVVRLAVTTSADAAATFAAEVARARGAAPSWFAAEVTGLGDEAFCTRPSAGGAIGVLARRGHRLAYGSFTAPMPSAGASAGPSPPAGDGEVRAGAPSGCRAAALIAEAALNH